MGKKKEKNYFQMNQGCRILLQIKWKGNNSEITVSDTFFHTNAKESYFHINLTNMSKDLTGLSNLEKN